MKFKKTQIYFMTRLISSIILFFFVLSHSFGQDLFNEENSSKFAEFLFKTQQFNLAAQEYERLVFLAPGNSNYKLSLLQSYRYSGDLTSAQKKMIFFFGDSLFKINQTFGTEYLKLQILQGNLTEAQNYIRQNSRLDENVKDHYKTCIYLIGGDWKRADSTINKSPHIDNQLMGLTDKAMHLKHRKPALAATFSLILPGSGKAYCGYWKDGLISLLFVSANAWQTYRGYSKFGIKSTHFYFFTGLTAGFYIGNIYGSWKAAKRYNKKANDKIRHESENFILSTF